jgi:hypothetical protein
MNLNDFSNVVRFEGLTPETHDFYLATFTKEIDHQTFLDHAHTNIADLTAVWFKSLGTNVYFIVPKLTVIPEDFAHSVTKVEEIAPEPAALDEPAVEE